MARPERNTVDYFPHLIGSGKKMFFIESKYGNDGYATWFKILEKLCVTENHFLNLNEEQDVLFLSSACRVDEGRLLNIISDLVKIGVLNKLCWEKKIVWSDLFIESIQDAYKRRNNKCITFEGLCLHLQGLCITVIQQDAKISDSNNQSKVKYIKVNKSKVNETKQDLEISENFNFKMSLLQYGFKNELVDDWLKVRKKKKATNTQTAFKKFISEVEKINLVSINEILELCVERSWSGFKAEWYENSKPLTNGATFNKSKEHPLTGLRAASSTILEQYAGGNGRTGN